MIYAFSIIILCTYNSNNNSSCLFLFHVIITGLNINNDLNFSEYVYCHLTLLPRWIYAGVKWKIWKWYKLLVENNIITENNDRKYAETYTWINFSINPHNNHYMVTPLFHSEYIIIYDWDELMSMADLNWYQSDQNDFFHIITQVDFYAKFYDGWQPWLTKSEFLLTKSRIFIPHPLGWCT